MRTTILGLAAASLLAACSGDTATDAKPEEAKADALKPGEYEVSAKVDELRSIDHSTPATKMKVAAAGETLPAGRACVGKDGAIDPVTFAESGDKCRPSSSYLRGGRMSLQYNCTRAGTGELTQLVDGQFTADSFEAQVMTSTYFSGGGDYAMTRTLTGKRVGDCPATPDKSPQQKAAS